MPPSFKAVSFAAVPRQAGEGPNHFFKIRIRQEDDDLRLEGCDKASRIESGHSRGDVVLVPVPRLAVARAAPPMAANGY